MEHHRRFGALIGIQKGAEKEAGCFLGLAGIWAELGSQ